MIVGGGVETGGGVGAFDGGGDGEFVGGCVGGGDGEFVGGCVGGVGFRVVGFGLGRRVVGGAVTGLRVGDLVGENVIVGEKV